LCTGNREFSPSPSSESLATRATLTQAWILINGDGFWSYCVVDEGNGPVKCKDWKAPGGEGISSSLDADLDTGDVLL